MEASFSILVFLLVSLQLFSVPAEPVQSDIIFKDLQVNLLSLFPYFGKISRITRKGGNDFHTSNGYIYAKGGANQSQYPSNTVTNVCFI